MTVVSMHTYLTVFFLLFRFGLAQPDSGILFPATNGTKWGYIDSTGNIKIQLQFEMAYEFNGELARVVLNGKYGIIDKEGKTVIEIKYDYLNDFSGSLVNGNLDGESVWINRKGKVVIKNKYQFLEDSKGPYRQKMLNGKKYWFNDKGIVTEAGSEIQTYLPFSDHLMKFDLKGGTSELVDESGLKVGKIKYSKILVSKSGRSLFKHKKRIGFLNINGEVAIRAKFSDGKSFSYGMAEVKKNGKWGIIDTLGRFMLKPEYEFLQIIDQNFTLFKQNGKLGFLENNNWKVMIRPEFDNNNPERYYMFHDSLAAASINGKIGIINMKGELVAKAEFDDAEYIGNGIFSVLKNRKWGCINRKGNPVVPLIYDDIRTCYFDSLFTVRSGPCWGMINLRGDTIISFKLPFEPYFSEKISWCIYGDKFTCLDLDGKIINQLAVFPDVRGFKHGLIKISRDRDANFTSGNFGYMRKDGKIVWIPDAKK